MPINTINLILNIISLTVILILLILIISSEYSLYKKKIDQGKLIEYYRKDSLIDTKELKDDRERIYEFIENDKVIIRTHSNSILYSNFDKETIKVKEYTLKEKTIKKRRTISFFFSIFFLLVFIFLLAFNIYSRINNNLYVINDTTYITIKTGSMSYVNEENDYLIENELTNQIKTNSLIGLKKVNEDTELKLYDICAYKDENNNYIVHRIVNITIKDNQKYYTFQGDANELSDYFLVKEEQIEFIFTGYQNYPLGFIISFASSTIGIISITYILIALYVIDLYDSKKEKYYRLKADKNISLLNKNEINKATKGYKVVRIYK